MPHESTPVDGAAVAGAHTHVRSQWAAQYRGRLIVADIAAVIVTVCVALALAAPTIVSDLPAYAVAGVTLVPAWIGVLHLAGAYETRFLGVSPEEFRAVGRALVGCLSAVAIGTTLNQTPVSRVFLIIACVLIPTFAVAIRGIMREWLRRQRSAGLMMQSAVIIGRPDAAAALVRSMQRDPRQGLRPVAICALDDGKPSGVDLGEVETVPVVASPMDAIHVVDTYAAEAVVVASHADLSGSALRRLAWALEERDVELLVAPGLLDVAGPRMSIRPSAEMALLHIERPATARSSLVSKALFDRMVAALLILALSPVLIAAALAVRFTSAGPAIFTQTRIGRGGRPFTIFKFRTMFTGAEKHLESLRHLSEGNDVQFKMKKDPRVTPVGQILRRYSIDELPQLFNVLFGTMSLVGPRPQSQAEVDQYGTEASRRLNVVPGMTGLWQVSGRSDLSWEESVRLDVRYVDNWSMTLDTVILLRTFKAVDRKSVV